METVNSFEPLTTFAKRLTTDVWNSLKYGFELKAVQTLC